MRQKAKVKSEKSWRRALLCCLLGMLCIPAVNAQEIDISLSPTSITAWGITPYTARAEVSYRAFSLVLAGPVKPLWDMHRRPYNGVHPGLFYNPVRLQWWRLNFRAGAGYFLRKFPGPSHTNLNVNLVAGIRIAGPVSLSYSHISNASRGRMNAGVDNLSLTITLNPTRTP
mgnify:FL=1